MKDLVVSLLPEALNFLERLVLENSWTANPAGVRRNARIVARQFEPLGFRAEYVPARDARYGDHLFLHRPGQSGAASLLLVSHLDTVYSAEEEQRNHFAWSVEGDRIYGPGVLDIKGGTAMIWLVLSALRVLEPELFARTGWLIAANAAEEELIPDFPEACRERLPENCRAGLVFEACAGQGEQYSLVRSRKGSANLRISVEGRGAHAGSRHHEGANAIVQLSRIIEHISALTDAERALTVNVGWVAGGGPINRVPHAAVCEVNIRAFEEPILQEAVSAVEAVEQDASVRALSDGFPCRIKVETMSRNPTWAPSAATDSLITHWKAAAETAGIALVAEDRGGLSDGNYLSRFLPVLDGLGPFGRNGHASERSADGRKVPEYVVPQSLVEMGALNVSAIIRLLQP